MALLKNIAKPEDLFKSLPELETMRLRLRRLSMHDAGDIFEYASDPEVSKYVLWDHHRTIADSKSYLKHVLFLYSKGIPASWGIVLKEENKLIGTGGYQWWSVADSKAEVGYVISKSYWNKGYMTEALEEILRFGFEQMELVRIEAKCFVQNTASVRVMEKCGMKLEGTLRSYKYVKGNFGDFKLYSILSSEFNQN
jgi:ribosomal-protein-alanine N-acetyltransferase